MRKVLMLLLIIGLCLYTSSVFASTVPDKILKTKVITASEVLTTGAGWLVYSFRVYANGGTNAIAGLYDCDTLIAASTAKVKSENGEPTQYQVSSDAIGDYPIEFTDGLTVVVNDHAYAIIQYED